MNTIVIPVSDKRPEDNILELVNLLQQEFGEIIVKVSNALVIETENPNIAAIFRKVAENNGSNVAKINLKPTENFCPDCGKPVKKEGNRCKGCANRFYKKQHKENLEFVTEIREGDGNGIGE